MFITAHESRYTKVPPIRTSDIIAKEVEDYLDAEVARAASEKAIFEYHQAALDLLIAKLRGQGVPLKLMKDGYDALIAKLSEDARQHDKKRLQKTKSILLMAQYADEEKGNVTLKFEKLAEHIRLVKSLTLDLTEEIEKLRIEVRTMKRENANRDLMVRVRSNRVSELARDLEAITQRHANVYDALVQKRTKIANLQHSLEGELSGTREVLTSVYGINSEIERVKAEISNLRNEIQEKEEFIHSSTREKDTLTQTILAVTNEIQQIRDETTAIETENEHVKQAIRVKNT